MNIILSAFLCCIITGVAFAQTADIDSILLSGLKNSYVYGEPIEFTITNLGKETLAVCNFSLLRPHSNLNVWEIVVPDMLNMNCPEYFEKVVTACKNIKSGDSQTIIWDPSRVEDTWSCRLLLDNVVTGQYKICFSWYFFNTADSKKKPANNQPLQRTGSMSSDTFCIRHKENVAPDIISFSGLQQTYKYGEPIECQIVATKQPIILTNHFWLQHYDDSSGMWINLPSKPITTPDIFVSKSKCYSPTVLTNEELRKIVESPNNMIKPDKRKTITCNFYNGSSWLDSDSITNGQYRISFQWRTKEKVIISGSTPKWKYSQLYNAYTQPFQIAQ